MIKRLLLHFLFICMLITNCNAQSVGTASYYSKKLHGRKTTSGERYNNKAYTAAHRSLPLGSYVRVTNLKNQKTVVVKINDRGSFRNRIIDLSYAAAEDLDMIRNGVAKVKLELIPDTIPQLFPDSIANDKTGYIKIKTPMKL